MGSNRVIGDAASTAVATGPSRRAQQKADTRRRLLDAATEVFLKHGPISPPLDLVAERAGVSKATLFFHFASRVDLIAALARDLYERQFTEFEQPPDADFRQYLQAYLRAQARPEVRLIWQLGDLLADGRTADLDAAYQHLVGETRRRLVSAGLTKANAEERSLVLTPALMLVGRRAALDAASETELKRFVTAATRLAFVD